MIINGAVLFFRLMRINSHVGIFAVDGQVLTSGAIINQSLEHVSCQCPLLYSVDIVVYLTVSEHHIKLCYIALPDI